MSLVLVQQQKKKNTTTDRRKMFSAQKKMLECLRVAIGVHACKHTEQTTQHPQQEKPAPW